MQVSFHWSSRSASQVAHVASVHFKASFPFNWVGSLPLPLRVLLSSFHIVLFEEFDVDIVRGFWGQDGLYRLLNRLCIFTFLVRKIGLYLLVLLDSAELDTVLKVISSHNSF